MDDPTRKPEAAAPPEPPVEPAASEHAEREEGLDLDLSVERIETEGVMKEGFTGQEM